MLHMLHEFPVLALVEVICGFTARSRRKDAAQHKQFLFAGNQHFD